MEKNHSAKAGSHPANRRPPGTKDANKASGSSPSGVEIGTNRRLPDTKDDNKASGSSPSGLEIGTNRRLPGTKDANKASGSSPSGVQIVIDDIKSLYDETTKSNKVKDLDLKALIDHLNKLLQLYQKKEKTAKPSKLSHSFWTRSKDLFSNGMKQAASGLKGLISCSEAAKVATDLFDQVKDSNGVLTTAFLIVSYILDGFQNLSDNKEECLRLLEEMITLGEFVNELNRDKRTALKKKHMEKSIVMIMEGSLLCCSLMTSSKIGQFFKAKANKDELSDLEEKVKRQYTHIIALTGTLIYDKVSEDQYTRLPELNIYPENAVGIEKPTEKILQYVDWESERKLVAVIIHGIGGIGKSTLAKAVYSKFCDKKNCKCIRVVVETKPSPESIKILQRSIIKNLMETDKPLTDISLEDGRQHLGSILQEQPAFIYIDNVLNENHLQDLLPIISNWNSLRKLRLLITTRDKGVGGTLPKDCRHYHQMEGLSREKAVQLVKQKMVQEEIDPKVLEEIIDNCGGVPLFLELIAGFIAGEEDKDRAYDIFREEIKRVDGHLEIFNGDSLAELVGYNNLRKDLIDPFLDICSYFKGYRWHVVANIVETSLLYQLEKKSLVKNVENYVTVHDILLKLGTRKSKGTRIIGTSEISHHLNCAKRNKDMIHSIKGLWFKQDKDGCPISARKLDPVSSSLRVLGLEGSRRTITEDNYDITFPELIYIWAGINPLPFDVSKLKKLQSLAYSPQNPEELNLKMPISLKQLWLSGELYSLDYIDLHQRFKTPLTNLRSLTFAHFHQLKKLPKELGSHKDLISLEIIHCANFVEFPENLGLPLLKYLKLSSCKSLKKLPKASELKQLNTLLLSGCNKLQELCNNFKDLQSLEYLRLSDCPMLEASCMEVIVNMKKLKVVDIRGSKMLLEKWQNMESPNLTRSFRVKTGKV